MIFEIIAEDASGEKMLDHLVPKILAKHGNHEFRITVASTLKNQLLRTQKIVLEKTQHKPFLFQVIGAQIKVIAKTMAPDEIVVIVIDSDGENPVKLRNKIQKIIDQCSPSPRSITALAIEEGEAWLLGDQSAIKKVFPEAIGFELDKYQTSPKENGTWEILADAVYPGGSTELKKLGYPRIGIVKCDWADTISPHIDANVNQSPSFVSFRDEMRAITSIKQGKPLVQETKSINTAGTRRPTPRKTL